MMASGFLPVDGPRIVELHQGDGPARARAEGFLEGTYARAFGGRIRAHYPTLMSVGGVDGQILAAVGFRFASAGPLFLEQYLDEPVEIAITRRLGASVARSSIVEIGNLASSGPCVSQALFSAMAGYLDRMGATHAVATATRQLRRSFERLRFPVAFLAQAEPGRLAEGAADWGGYYDRDPQVLVGQIGQTLPELKSSAIGADAVAARLARRAGLARQTEAAH